MIWHTTKPFMDQYPWYILAFSPCNILRIKPFETTAGPDMNEESRVKPWIKQYTTGGAGAWPHELPLELPQLASLYNSAKIWGSKWFFKITNWNVNMRERPASGETQELRFNDIDMLEIWLWIPDKDRKDPWEYNVTHLNHWAHTVKKSFINIEKGYYAWDDNSNWISYTAPSSKQKKTAKLSTGYIPNWRIIYEYKNKREFREDEEIDQAISNFNFLTESQVRREKQPYLYLALKPVNKKGWSNINTRKFTFHWNVFIKVKVIFWIEFKNLREWRQTIIAPPYNGWGDIFPGKNWNPLFPQPQNIAATSWPPYDANQPAMSDPLGILIPGAERKEHEAISNYGIEFKNP
jgi:hypothetical protein